ncbi:hypothetical protein B0T18DRAFT_443275 [Schizothecium vesticola]|uniref:Secreted protein n=1 Tax=Schizothecium vesticola TaxID=314040 RepID=A0AA40KDD1_9PEZI|nr:hypothetical protein B0T18DRAFT_443275 [Schizothecium vesticola]
MKSESLLALFIALFAVILTASPLPPAANANSNAVNAEIIDTDGRSGYNSVPADPNAPIETDGRSGYNAIQPVPREGRSGYNGVVSFGAPRSVAGTVETDGRSGYNGVTPGEPAAGETDGREDIPNMPNALATLVSTWRETRAERLATVMAMLNPVFVEGRMGDLSIEQLELSRDFLLFCEAEQQARLNAAAASGSTSRSTSESATAEDSS